MKRLYKIIIAVIGVSLIFLSCNNNTELKESYRKDNSVESLGVVKSNRDTYEVKVVEVTDEMEIIYDYLEEVWDSYESKYSTDEAEARVFIDGSKEFNKPIIEIMRVYCIVQNNEFNQTQLEPAALDALNVIRLESIDFHKIKNEWFYDGKKVNMGDPLPKPEEFKPQEPAENKEIIVKIEAEVIMESGKVYFKGETNLPKETTLMVTLSSKGYKAQDKVSVKNGEFLTSEFTQKGKRLKAGKYKLRIVSPTASVQPSAVKVLIGEKGKNMVGDFVKFDEVFGNMIEYILEFEIE